MSDVDDAGLLDRARRGDEVAFSQLFARYQRAIYRYAAYLCGRDAADDIVQDTFVAVLRQTRRHDAPRSTVQAYLLGIARRLVSRRLASREEVPSAEPPEGSSEASFGALTTLDELTRTETIEMVRAAVQSLPAAYREVVVLCDLQEMDYAAAAGVMECPVGTVRSRLHRARSLLTRKLAAYQPSAGGRRG